MEKEVQLKKIRLLFARHLADIRLAGALGLTDLYKISENFMIPLLKPALGLNELKNLNVTHHSNFPAIDLGDEKAKVAVQVTATPDSEKVKKTLKKFIEHNLQEKYDKLYIYILTKKKSKYPVRTFREITEGHIEFDSNSDIIDADDLIERFSHFTSLELEPVVSHLEQEYGESKKRYTANIKDQKHLEAVVLNMVETSFPDTIYVADLDIDRTSVIEASWETERKLKKSASQRQVVEAALRQSNARYFYTDWVVHSGQLITFDDLENPKVGLRKVIDKGTIIPLSPSEYYEAKEDLEKVFKELLSRCLEQILYEMNIRLQYDDNLFIYLPLDEEMEDRKEDWAGKKTSGRTVFTKTMSERENEQGKIWYAKHFAFKARFHRVGSDWYMTIRPSWFFSRDGKFRKYSRSSDKVDWLKRNERNALVLTQFSFLHNQLVAQGLPKQVDIFSFTENEGEEVEYKKGDFLRFGKLVSFNSAPSLPDKEWLKKEPKEEYDLLTENQLELALSSRADT